MNTKIDMTMKELANYIRMQEEISQVIDGLKDELKSYMTENKCQVLAGSEHKATWKPVVSSRLDSSALKKELPDVAEKYTRKVETMRFTFA